jgi:hypothetical protein
MGVLTELLKKAPLGMLVLIFLLCGDAYAHKKKNHKDIKCIPEDQLTQEQLRNQKFWNHWHRLTKNQQNCLILELEKKNEMIKTIGEAAQCPKIPFNHRSSANTSLFLKTDVKSKKLKAIKKNDNLLFISEASKGWGYVSIRTGNKCIEGYILSKFIVQKDEVDTTKKVGPELISIIEPKWKKINKLIIIDAEGTVSITGAVQEGKIDQILINEEEEQINSDNSFIYLLFVPKTGAEVRIVGNKNGKKVKELIFKVQVGN